MGPPYPSVARSALEERHSLHTGDVKAFPAAKILTGDLVVQKHHVTLCLLELSPIALVAALRNSVFLLTDHPSQIVAFDGSAIRAVQRRRFCGLRLRIECALIHRASSFRHGNPWL